MRRSKTTALVIGALCAGLAGAQSREQAEALELMRKSMCQAMQINVVAVIERRGELDGLMRKVKLEQARGRQALTVLHPLSDQGVRYVDDGKVRITYVPDERTMFEEHSIRPMLKDIEARLELANKNYVLRTEKADPVAGRSTLRIIATPKDVALPSRQFILDEKTLFLLRMATITPDGERNVHVDTKVVAYPKKVDSSCLKVETIGASRKVVRHPAMPVAMFEGLSKKLGFEPAVPTKLPLGFIIQNAELRRSETARSFSLRITDGLASAQVYQYRDTSALAGLNVKRDLATFTENGVSTTLVSDLPKEARIKLLSAFARKPLSLVKMDISVKVDAGSPVLGPGGSRVMPVPAPEPKAVFRMFPSEEEDSLESEVPRKGPQPLDQKSDEEELDDSNDEQDDCT